MVRIDLRYQKTKLIDSLKDQGILNYRVDEFTQSSYFLDAITRFISSAHDCIAEIDKNLNAGVVGFSMINMISNKLRSSSTNIGGIQVAIACYYLRIAAYTLIKEECILAFNKVKDAFQILKDNLNAIAEIERILISNRRIRRNVSSDSSSSRPGP